MSVDAKTLAILACPLCKGSLHWNAAQQQLICRAEKLAFPLQHGIPMLLSSAAIELSSDEVEQLCQ